MKNKIFIIFSIAAILGTSSTVALAATQNIQSLRNTIERSKVDIVSSAPIEGKFRNLLSAPVKKKPVSFSNIIRFCK